MAYENKQIGLQEWIYVRWNGTLIKTTVGRVIFNFAFPERWNHEFLNCIVDKGGLKKTITDCYRRYGNAETARFLDAIKDLGFHYATLSGTTVSINDVIVPENKYEIVGKAQDEVDELHRLYEQGFISEDEAVQQDDRHLVEGFRRGDDLDAVVAESAQPGLHDGDVGRARFDRAGQAARRHARIDVGSVRANSRDSGQGVAQRRADGARVLHFDARRAQGSRRHGAAHGRLRLPHAAAR